MSQKKTCFGGKFRHCFLRVLVSISESYRKSMETFSLFPRALHLEIAEFFFLARPYEGNSVGWLINPRIKGQYPPIPGWFSPKKMPPTERLGGY